MPVIPKSETHQALMFNLPPGMAYQVWDGHHQIVMQKGEAGKLYDWLKAVLDSDLGPFARDEEERIAKKKELEIAEVKEEEAKKIADLLASIPSRARAGTVQSALNAVNEAGVQPAPVIGTQSNGKGGFVTVESPEGEQIKLPIP